MAGDWIKMRCDLPSDPAVYKLAALTKLDRFAVVGRLYAFWSWADKHAVDGLVDGATSHVVDDVASHVGFADALVAVKWLEIGDDCVRIPHHDRHNGESAKERGLKNARQARWRQSKDAEPSTAVDAPPSTQASTREEKRREEKNLPTTTEVVAAAEATDAPKKPRGTRLPKEWHLPKAWGQWAMAEFPTWGEEFIRQEAERFRCHWVPKTGKDATKLDWEMTWQGWCRRSNGPSARNTSAGALSFRERDQQAAAERVREMTGGLVSADLNRQPTHPQEPYAAAIGMD